MYKERNLLANSYDENFKVIVWKKLRLYWKISLDMSSEREVHL